MLVDLDCHPSSIIARARAGGGACSRQGRTRPALHGPLPPRGDRHNRCRSPAACPANPQDVSVSRPSDGLAAQIAAKSAYNTLLLGVGAIALIVGAVGIANVMVMAIIHRRREIGLRRALGATRRHIAIQFTS
jgi:hypothetical protein